jgi:hypothetical protein
MTSLDRWSWDCENIGIRDFLEMADMVEQLSIPVGIGTTDGILVDIGSYFDEMSTSMIQMVILRVSALQGVLEARMSTIRLLTVLFTVLVCSGFNDCEGDYDMG